MQKPLTNKYTCAILDDDPSSVEFISQQLSNISYINILGRFTDPVEATRAFITYDVVDFLFLDIGMEVSGIDIARMLKNQVRFIVFVTGYTQFALEAFENGDAYLVKPVDLETLKRAITHLLQKHKKQVFEDS